MSDKSALSSIGLPGTNGFVGEFLILVGTFRTHPIPAILATSGVIFAAAYMLPMVQRVLFGPITDTENAELTDLGGRERAILAPMLILIIVIGVYPGPLLRRTESSVAALIEQVEKRAQLAPLTMNSSIERLDRLPILGFDAPAEDAP